MQTSILALLAKRQDGALNEVTALDFTYRAGCKPMRPRTYLQDFSMVVCLATAKLDVSKGLGVSVE